MKLSALSALVATVLVWTHAHPVLVAAVVLFAISSAHDDLAKFPRLQALAKIAGGLGFDLPKVIAGILQVLTGSPSAPVAAVKLLPPVALLFLLAGCSGAMDAALAAYGAQNTACVTMSTSRAQAETCVAKVQDTWCGDGGLWTNSDAGLCAKDAGHE